MNIIPAGLLQIIEQETSLHSATLDIQSKVTRILNTQSPIFFSQYTNHGIEHFSSTLKMAYHLVDSDEMDKSSGTKAVVDYFSPLNAFILSSSILLHDLGMHIHFKGFKQLINGYYDDVRVSFFDENIWKKEWDNFFIEAKRFSGRELMNIFGDENVDIKDVDFDKDFIDSEIQKTLIGEFLRRHHGRLSHEIALKGFPVQNNEFIQLGNDVKPDFRDIIGLIARSHTMRVRDALTYIEEIFPADPHFPYKIEIPLLMCILRIADYFQFDNSRTDEFFIKLMSLNSPFSLREHQAHLATEYFKPDEKDPETLFVDIKPKDGLMYTKLTRLFDDIQQELDTSFAILGEMYGRHKPHLRLRYRRINTSLKNKKVIERLRYVPQIFRFEADIDLFKLLVGPLYGHEPAFGIRELIQNAVDACNERTFSDPTFTPLIEVKLFKSHETYFFEISDNGKGMSVVEIKNYFLRAGASFRNSLEWKVTFEDDTHHSRIRRTGKFGIGVLAAFLIGHTIEVTTKRYNVEEECYHFLANLTNEFIEVEKIINSSVGTTIKIEIEKDVFERLIKEPIKLVQWYIFNTPKINYYINNQPVSNKPIIKLITNTQSGDNLVKLNIQGFEDIVWTYIGEHNYYSESKKNLAVNGIIIPQSNYWSYYASRLGDDLKQKKSSKLQEQNLLENYPFVSVIDKNNSIDYELNRNSIRGDLPFLKELIKSCQLDFLSKLILTPINYQNGILQLKGFAKQHKYDKKYEWFNKAKQYRSSEILATDEGFLLFCDFYKNVISHRDKYRVFKSSNFQTLHFINNSICHLYESTNNKSKQDIIRGEHAPYVAIAKRDIYHNNVNKKTIAENIRSNLKIIKETNEFVVFKSGDYDNYDISRLIKLFETNQAEAVQLIKSLKYTPSNVDGLFKEHFLTPRLIPYDLLEKKNFIKSCSLELQKYMEEKEYVDL